MAGAVGRKLLLKKNNAVLVGIRNKSIAFNDENINITSGEDNGFQLLLEDGAEKNISISFDGVSKDSLLQDIALSGGSLLFSDIELEWWVQDGNTTPATLTGNFRMSNIEETGAYNDAVTFSGQLDSSGTWVYTAGA